MVVVVGADDGDGNGFDVGLNYSMETAEKIHLDKILVCLLSTESNT